MKHKKEAALVCFSGGQDSTTCLFWAKKHFSRVEAVCFTYGQKHSLEIEVARKIAADADVPFQLLDVSLISQLDPNCSLTNTGISMDQEKPADSYPNTFVPGRNMVFLTFAAILARSKGIFNLVTGVSEADFSGYPDCRDTFVRSLNVTLNLAMDEQFVIHTPDGPGQKRSVGTCGRIRSLRSCTDPDPHLLQRHHGRRLRALPRLQTTPRRFGEIFKKTPINHRLQE